MLNLLKRDCYFILKKGTMLKYSVICLLTIMLLTFGYENIKKSNEATKNDWKYNIEDELQDLSSVKLKKDDASENVKKIIKIDKYRLKHNISDNDWRVNLVKSFLYKTCDQKEEQKAIDSALSKNNWKIYYKYRLKRNKDIINSDDGLERDIEEAKLQDIIINLYFEYNIVPEGRSDIYNDWRNEEIYKYYDANMSLKLYNIYYGDSDYYLSGSEIKNLKQVSRISLYRIKNNIKSNDLNNSANLYQYLLDGKYVVFLCCLLYFFKISNDKFKRKIIRTDIIVPVERKVIYFEREIMFIGMYWILSLIYWIVAFLSVSVLHGVKINDFIYIINGKVGSMNFYLYLFIMWLTAFIEIYIIQNIIRIFELYDAPITISIFVSIFLLLGKFLIKEAAHRFHLYVLKYIPVVWFDWGQFVGNQPYVSGTKAGLCIIGSCLIVILCVLHSYKVFEQKSF